MNKCAVLIELTEFVSRRTVKIVMPSQKDLAQIQAFIVKAIKSLEEKIEGKFKNKAENYFGVALSATPPFSH